MSAATDHSRAAAWGVLRALSGYLDARIRADGRAPSALAVHVWSNRSMDIVARATMAGTSERPADVSDAAVSVRACLDGERDVYLDATAHGLRVGPVDAEGETPFSDVVAGHMVNARLLCAVLDALPRGPVEIVWRGRLEPLTLHAVEGPPHVRDAVVMPMRCCSCVTADHGTFHVGSVRLSCGCRDCAAGRQWGW